MNLDRFTFAFSDEELLKRLRISALKQGFTTLFDAQVFCTGLRNFTKFFMKFGNQVLAEALHFYILQRLTNRPSQGVLRLAPYNAQLAPAEQE